MEAAACSHLRAVVALVNMMVLLSGDYTSHIMIVPFVSPRGRYLMLMAVSLKVHKYLPNQFMKFSSFVFSL